MECWVCRGSLRSAYRALQLLCASSAAIVQGNHGVLGVPGLSSSPSPVHVPSLWEVGVLQITMLLMFPPGIAVFCA
jgi:hypothetical protein